MSTEQTDVIENTAAATEDFYSEGLQKLESLRDNFQDLEDLLLDIDSVSDSEKRKQVAKLRAKLAKFEPSITMIGQIKAGKTSLVNAMIGRPNLLPADVNPWTSVVTSLHMNSAKDADAPEAKFQFFGKDEWTHLVDNGGRIGELSSRAGADEELQKVHDQIKKMQDKVQERLGRKFELLLGQQHVYEKLDENLIQRYVCMGDDFESLSIAEQRGQFADITKSADLYLDAPSIPIPLCIRDTPGVNDTFMVREQITIQSLRQSKICVVVLSATQALSSVDMGLIRLVSNVKARKVVIFVNRIDELSDPVSQLPDVEESIRKTLEDHNGPKDVKIVFGSAYWANLAMAGSDEHIQEDSAKALAQCAEQITGNSEIDLNDKALIWKLSGMPELFDCLSERICEGEGHEITDAIYKKAHNLVSGMMASGSLITMRLEGSEIEVMEPEVLAARLDEFDTQVTTAFESRLDEILENFRARIDTSHHRFLSRALESLLQHLEKNGENEVWQYSPEGLRILLRSGYAVMGAKLTTACDEVYMNTAEGLAQTYRDTLSVEVENFSISPPRAPEMPAPVSLGQTIALDLQTSWWKGWWKSRKGYRAYADGFRDLIHAETSPLVEELKIRQTAEIKELALERLRDFLAEQRHILMDVSEKTSIDFDELQQLFGITKQEGLMEVFETLLEEIETGFELNNERAVALVGIAA